MKVAAYCRVSTEKSDQLNSLETQKEFFESYCTRNKDILVQTYADEGISGTKIKNRREFQRMMKEAEMGMFEQVIVKDVSRLARNTVDLLQSVRKLKLLNIETVFITSDMKTMGNSEFVLTLMGAMAQEESSNTSKRVKFGKKENAKKGRVPNIVFGYDKTPGDYFNLAINEDEAKIVKQIYQWYTEEGYGAGKISCMLNERGITTKRNCQWSQNAVSRILKNEIYIGNIVNGKEEIADFLTGTRREKEKEEWFITSRDDLAIIEKKQFQSAQDILSNRKNTFHTTKQRQSNKYLFSTLIKCAECGYSFRRIERKYKNTSVCWVCSGRNTNGSNSCHNKVKINEAELQDIIKKYFTDMISEKDTILPHIMVEYKRFHRAITDQDSYEKELKAKIAKHMRNKDKYTQMFLDDLLTRKELKEKVALIKEELVLCENELSVVSCQLNKGNQLEKMIEETFDGMRDIFDRTEITNAQLKKVIKQIVVQKDGTIDIYLRLFNHLRTVPEDHDRT